MPEEVKRERPADVESQYRELKELRRQLAIEQSKLLQQMPVNTKH
jgi:hypothetical protein